MWAKFEDDFNVDCVQQFICALYFRSFFILLLQIFLTSSQEQPVIKQNISNGGTSIKTTDGRIQT